MREKLIVDRRQRQCLALAQFFLLHELVVAPMPALVCLNTPGSLNKCARHGVKEEEIRADKRASSMQGMLCPARGRIGWGDKAVPANKSSVAASVSLLKLVSVLRSNLRNATLCRSTLAQGCSAGSVKSFAALAQGIQQVL